MRAEENHGPRRPKGNGAGRSLDMFKQRSYYEGQKETGRGCR